jgi:hypothetical protein
VRSIGLLVYNHIVDDPRVRRQGDTFHAAGWKVYGVGIPGGRSDLPAWSVLDDGPPLPELMRTLGPEAIELPVSRLRHLWRANAPGTLKRAIGRVRPHANLLWHRARYFGRRYGARAIVASKFVGARVSFEEALRTYWQIKPYEALYERARQVRPDIWIANDWNTLPIAARLSEATGIPYGYDSHEFAISEYEERFAWRLLQRPIVALIERNLIARAVAVSTVSPGISAALKQLYGLDEEPMTVMNAPFHVASPFRPTSEPGRVLYHGGVTPGRGLEATIESVPLWAGGRTLTIRGPADPDYRAQLEAIIARCGVKDRVTLDPPIPMTALVEAAREFDIGILALPNHSRQNRFALPNKLFEYAMAGLALCMSDLPEMSALMRRFDMGTTIRAVTPAAIATAVNSLTTARIDASKRNALEAAKVLSWDEGGRRLVEKYASLVG